MKSLGIFCRFHPAVQNNKLFSYDVSNNEYVFLKNYFNSKNWRVDTLDVLERRNQSPDCILFLDAPVGVSAKYLRSNILKIIILRENENIIPQNYEDRYLSQADWILTWDHRIKTRYPLKSIMVPSVVLKPQDNFSRVDIPYDQKMFLAMVSSNLPGNKNSDNYNLRKHTAYWFSKNCGDKFSLFGRDWDKHVFKIFSRTFRLPRSQKLSCYKGLVDDKNSCLSNYKFSLCLENSSFPNYISEKIYDCFHAKNVPIYFGAQNVSEYIPASTFIDLRNFEDLRELTDFLHSMSADDYQKYIDAAFEFLNSSYYSSLRVDKFIERIYSLCEA